MAVLNELRTVWTGVAGSPYYTTLRHLSTAAISFEDFKAAWGTFLATAKSNYDNALVAQNSAEVRQIESTTGQTVGVFTTTQGIWAGTSVGEALPPMTQLLIRLSTNNFTNGRRIRGRIFLPGQVENNNSTVGQPDAGYTGTLATALATMVTAMGNSLVIYSPTHRTYAVVQSATPWNQWAVLRSRRD